MAGAIDSEQHESPVKWFELFYDLVIVAAVVTFSDSISSRPTLANVAWIAFTFAIIWIVWFATTFRFNHDRRDGLLDRLIIVVQMAALSVCSIALGEGPGEERVVVALSFGIVVATLAVMTWRSGRLQHACRRFFRARTRVLVFAAVCVAASAGAPGAWYPLLWAVAALAYLGFWVIYHLRPNWQVPPLDVHHLAERLGLLTIIVLGESFVKLAIVASADDVTTLDIQVGMAMFVCVFGIFWAYFDDVPEAGITGHGGRRFALLSGHLIMQIGCIGLAIGLTYLAKDSSVSAGWRAGSFAAASVVMVYCGMALLGPGTCRRPIRALTGLRLGTAGVVAVLSLLLPIIESLNPNVIGYVLAAVIIGHGVLAEQLVKRSVVRTELVDPAAA